MTQNDHRPMTLWILSEERPKPDALRQALRTFAESQGLSGFIDYLRIVPLPNDGSFSFWYEVLGFRSPAVSQVLLSIVKGRSSFIDFLIFFQPEEPRAGDRPLLLIEETKTSDAESRNTGVFQRASKFVYADLHFPGADLYMFYNFQGDDVSHQTETNIFGTRCLLTLGVQILGKRLDEATNRPFASLEEMIAFREGMRRPPAGNVPVTLSLRDGVLVLTGRLFKAGGLSHDPNIGALTLMAATARRLGWQDRIVVAQHALDQHHLRPGNKFVRIANALDIELDGLALPKSDIDYPYWAYDRRGEKLATILLHLMVENFTNGRAIFENHAGSEKGYFITPRSEYLQLAKYVPKSTPRRSIAIPDLILEDADRQEIINLEGKTYANVELGISTLNNYDDIERLYVQPNYPDYSICRSVVLYGGLDEVIEHEEVCFLLNEAGGVILSDSAPELVAESVQNLHAFWQQPTRVVRALRRGQTELSSPIAAEPPAESSRGSEVPE